MRKICFSLPMFFVILLLFAACSGKQETASSSTEISQGTSNPVVSTQSSSTFPASESDAVSSDALSSEGSSSKFDYSATPPLEEEDFALYNDSGEKVWWLNQKFTARENSETQSLRPKAIPGTEYIGRRELRRIMPDDIYFYDVYKFENDVATIFAFNYVGNALRDMDNYYIHAVTTSDTNLITARGITIGDTKEEIMQLYGENDLSSDEYCAYYAGLKGRYRISFNLEKDIISEILIRYFPDELQYVEYPDTYQ